MSAPSPSYRPGLGWNLGISAYWFAISFKWFILLIAVLPAQVAAIVPEGEANTAWGRVFLLGAIWAAIGPALFGYLSDRTRSRFGKRKPYIAAGAALTAIACFVLAEAPSLTWLMLGYLLLQVSDDVGQGASSALIPQLVPKEHRGRASSIMTLLQQLAQIVAAVAFLLLGGAFLPMYVTIAAINLLCAGIVLYTLRGQLDHVPSAEPSIASWSGFFKGWIEPWRSRDFVRVWSIRFVFSLAFYMVQPYLRNFLADAMQRYELFGADLGDSEMAVTVLALAISLLAVLGALVAARLTDRKGRRWVALVGGVTMGLALTPFAFLRDYTSIFLLALVFGVGYGMFLSANWAMAADVLPSEQDAAKDMGIWQMSQSSVQVVAGSFGAVIDWGNRGAPLQGYTIAFVTAAVLFWVSTAMTRGVRHTT